VIAAKTCPDCGGTFLQQRTWETICFPCWKETKSYDLTKADYALREFQHYHAREITRLKQIISSMENKKRGAMPLEDRDLLGALIKFCHPDKHGGNKQANDITALLNSLRDEMS